MVKSASRRAGYGFLRATAWALGLSWVVGCTSSRTPDSVVALPLTTSGVWEAESVHPIHWVAPTDLGKIDETVTIIVSHDSGENWFEIAEPLLEDEIYRWVLPADYEKARIAVLFHLTDSGGNVEDLRMAESADVTIGPSSKKSYMWERVAVDAPFGPRDGAGGIVHNGKMWLLGGSNSEAFPLTTANDVWSSVDGATWVREKPNTFVDAATFDRTKDWEGRHFGGYQSFGGKMWIVGGDVNQGYYQTDVWSSTDGKQWTRTDIHTTTPRMNPSTGQPYPASEWRPVEEAQFGLRTAHVTGVLGDKLFLMGGQRMSTFVDPEWPGRAPAAFDDVWTSKDGAAFERVKTNGATWSPRGHVSEAAELGGRMWLVGGGLHEDPSGGRDKREYTNDVWSTADGATWAQTAEEPPFSPRFWHNVKAYDGRLWVINGHDGEEASKGRAGGNQSDVWYSADGRNWYPASPPESFVGRHKGTAWVHDDALFVGSGNATAEKWHADVWKLRRGP